MATQRIGISWPLSDIHGWGVFGLNLVLELARRAPPEPLLLSPPSFTAYPEEHRSVLQPLCDEQDAFLKQIEALGRQVTIPEIVVLHGLGRDFQWQRVTDVVRGRANVGIAFLEQAAFDDDALERARGFDRLIVGSSWNRDLLHGLGLPETVFVAQGIDPELFRPAPRAGTYGERFVVYSGGKLEMRKGQDIVLAAFRRFHESHSDSILVTNWHNPWPGRDGDAVASPHLSVAPEIVDGAYAITEWAHANGVPEGAFIDLGWVPNSKFASVVREGDVALFANRCEGGTNLVAMEAMACGVPCILSANSGHLDLIADDNCYPLDRQEKSATEKGWHESSLDEVVAALEGVYADRERARKTGERGAAFMRDWSWRAQTTKLLAAIEDLL